MSAAFFHIAWVHIPVLGVLLAFVLFLATARRPHGELRRFSLLLFVGCALAVVPAYLSGEGAEEIVEHAPGVGHAVIEAHEEMALIGASFTVAAGVLALALGVGFPLASAARTWLGRGLAVIGLAATVLMALTAHRGGLIRHPELQGGAAAASPGPDGPSDHLQHEDD